MRCGSFELHRFFILPRFGRIAERVAPNIWIVAKCLSRETKCLSQSRHFIQLIFLNQPDSEWHQSCSLAHVLLCLIGVILNAKARYTTFTYEI